MGRNAHLWLAGFYFNSAIQRIAAVYDRVPKLVGDRYKGTPHERMAAVNADDYADWRAVYTEMNSFKHDVEGRAKGRVVTMEIALNAADQAIGLLERKAADIASKYQSKTQRPI
jgi:flagellar basal body-associated protein FliL